MTIPIRSGRWRAALWAGSLALAGCVTSSSATAPERPQVALPPPPAAASELTLCAAGPPPPRPAGPVAPDKPLTLEDLLNQATASHPDVATARQRAQAARGRLIQAGLYPNPILTGRIDEFGNRENVWGMPALTIQQEIVTAHKIPLAKAAAAYGVEAADWAAITQLFLVVTRVRLAYYELLTAARDVEANKELLRIAEEGVAVAKKLEKAGAGTQPDVLRAQVDRGQSQIRLGVSRRRLEAAGRLLAAAVGLPALPCLPPAPGQAEGAPLLAGELEKPPPEFDWKPLLAAVLERSSEVQEAQALALQAEKALRLAKAQVYPNILTLVRPLYNAPLQDMEVLIEVGAAVPIFNRNQGNIFAAQADVARTRAEVRAVELRLTERLALAYQRYQAARQQVTTFERQILPGADESLRLVRLGYERGDPKYDYTAVLQAQQTQAQVRLSLVQARGELWRAVSDILGLLQLGGPGAPCGP